MMGRREAFFGLSRVVIVCLVASTIIGCAVSREVRLAQQFEREKNWDAATILYEEALRQKPDDQELRARLDEARVNAASFHFHRGQELFESGEVEPAFDEFKRALSFDPGRPEYREAFDAAKQSRQAIVHVAAGRQLLKAGRPDEALREFEVALEYNPSLVEAQEAIVQIAEQEELGRSADELALTSTDPITIKFRNARLKEVFELLSRSYGVNILFDRDVRDDNVTVFIKDTSFRQALSLILATNNLFMKRISENTILVIPKTKAKANQYQDLQIRTFYLSVMPAKEMVNLLRTMLDIRRVFVNNDLNTIVMRDSPEKLALASKIIAANDRQVAEVMFDVEIIEISRTKLLKYGWNLVPGNTVTGGIGSDADTATFSFTELSNLTRSNAFLTLPSVVVDFIKQDSEAETLANPRIRVLSGNTAKINIGDKFPILLSTSTSTAATAAVSGGGFTTTTTQFKDTGIKLTIEPTVHLNNDVEMKLSLDVTTLGEFVADAQQFKFGNRKAETVLNVHDGETVVIGGLISDQMREAVIKIPGLGDLPVLGKLFSHTDQQKVKTDLILTITPHVIRRLDPPGQELLAFWSGTEEAYSTTPLFSGLSFGGVPSAGGGRSEVVTPPPLPALPPSPRPLTPEEIPVPTPPGPPAPFRPSPPFPSGSYLPGQGLSAPEAVLRITPESLLVDAQQEVLVTVRLEHAESLSSARFSVSYDPDILEFQRAVEGDLLSRDGWATTFTALTPPDDGRIDLSLSRLSDQQGVQGAGTLCTLVFVGKTVGVSTLTLTNGQFADPDHAIFPVTPRQGVVVVR